MNRKHSIDLLRVMGAFAVVMLHTITAPVVNYGGELPMSLRINLNALEIMMGWVVPIFLMITGYCLSNKKECTYKYCFEHVKKYVAVLFTIGLFYALLEEVYGAMKGGMPIFSASVLGRSLLRVINGDLWAHMWFVYMIIGIYLVMPVIHRFMQTEERNIYILTALLFVFTIVLPQINEVTPLNISVDFPFVGYLFYVCFGGMIRKCGVKKWFYYLLVVCGIISFAVMVITHAKIGRFSDKHPLVSIAAMFVFVVISELDIKGNKLLYEIAASTWGIYLIHPVFFNIGIKLFNIDLLSHMPYLKLSCCFIVVFLLSFGTVWVLKRMPFFKNIL